MQIFFTLNVSTNNVSSSFALQGKKTIFFFQFYPTMISLGLAVFVVCAFSTTNLMLLSGYSLQESIQTIQMQISAKIEK